MQRTQSCVFGFIRKSPIFPEEAGYVGCVACVITRGVSFIRVSSRRLAMPRIRHGFKARHVLFSHRRGGAVIKGAKKGLFSYGWKKEGFKP